MNSNIRSLGNDASYNVEYDSDVLDRIERQTSRYQTFGWDIWNAYEVSWLNPKGYPENRWLEITIPASSPNIIESKSMKLYLNSYNMQQFETDNEILTRIQTDIESIIHDKVAIKWKEPCIASHGNLEMFAGKKVENLDNLINKTQTPGILDDNVAWVTHCFRSCCPVTSQPDWASVFFNITGPIDALNVYHHVMSYRTKDGFHESCMQHVFEWIVSQSGISSVTVMGRFLRRGGIDINPIRSTDETILPMNIRVPLQ